MKRILSILILLPGILYAQDNTLSGRISGQNEEGIYQGVIPGATIELNKEDGAKVGSTTTNETGYYTFPGLSKGKYTYKITAPDYEVDQGRGIELRGEKMDYVRDFILAKPTAFVNETGTLTGTASWEDGEKRSPLKNVLVSARRVTGGPMVREGSDEEGKFQFDLPAGDWKVSAFIAGYEPQVHPGVVTLGKDISADVEFVFSEAVVKKEKLADEVYALVSVKIKDSQAAPGVVPTVHYINSATGEQTHATVVLQEGHGEGIYEWYKADPSNPLKPGEYRVSADREEFPDRLSRPKSVNVGMSTWFDVDLTRVVPGREPEIKVDPVITGIHGRISGQNTKGEYLGMLAGAKVSFLNEAGEVVHETTTDETGYYRIMGIKGGNYPYKVESSDYNSENGVRGMEIKEGSGLHVFNCILSKEVPEVAMGEISGSVTKKENGKIDPLPGTTITIKREGKAGFYSMDTDAEGKFAEQVPAGRWAVSAVAGKYGMQVNPNFIQVMEGSEAKVDFVFEVDSNQFSTREVFALVSVQLGGTDNKGGKTPSVYFVADSGGKKYPAKVRPKTDAELVAAGLTPRSSGTTPYYEWYHAEAAEALPLGPYHVEASLDTYKDDRSESKTITKVGSTWFDADLVPVISTDPPPPPPMDLSMIHGRISGQTTTGIYEGVLPGSVVSIFDQSGRMIGAETTNSTGYYKFAKINPGQYTYRVGAPRGTPYEDDEGRGFVIPAAKKEHVLDIILARPVKEEKELPGEIHGQVMINLEEQRVPIPGAEVFVAREGTKGLKRVLTDREGKYSYTLPKGSWRVAAVEPEMKESLVHPNKVILGPGSKKQVDFLFELPPPPPPPLADLVILVKVERGPSERGGEPEVNLTGNGDTKLPALEMEYLGVNPASSELFKEHGLREKFEQGWHWYAAFPVSEVPAGTYQAKASLDGYLEGVSQVRYAPPGFVTFLDVALEKVRPEIDVYVECNDRQPIEDANLFFINKTTGKTFATAQKGQTDARGRFMTQLTDGLGEYNIMATADGFEARGKAVLINTNRASVQIQLFPPDAVKTIDFTGVVVRCGGFDDEGSDLVMTTPGGVAEGGDGDLNNAARIQRLQDGTDKRIAGAKVKITPQDSSVSVAQLSLPLTSDSMGEIKVEELPVGSYDVQVSAANHISWNGSFSVTLDDTEPQVFPLEPRNLELENWIRKIITKSDGWQNKKKSTYYHSEGVKEDPDDCRVDYALGLSMFNVSWDSATGSFSRALSKDPDDTFWDRAVEGHIWMLMAQRQGSKAASTIREIATTEYNRATPTKANLHTAFVMGKAVGVLKGPWSENNAASLRTYTQTDQAISAALQGQILSEYERGRDSIGGKAKDITEAAKSEADALARQAAIDKANREATIGKELADIQRQLEDLRRQVGILDAGWQTYDRNYNLKIAELERLIQQLIAQLRAIGPDQPLMTRPPQACEGCAAELGRYDPNCPYCQKLNAGSGQDTRATQLRNLLNQQKRNQIIQQINAYKAQATTLQTNHRFEYAKYQRERNRLAALDTNLRNRYGKLSGDMRNVPDPSGKIDDITRNANREKTKFETYCPYPLEERRLELLNWVNRKTDTASNRSPNRKPVASLSPAGVDKPPGDLIASIDRDPPGTSTPDKPVSMNPPKVVTPVPVENNGSQRTTASGLQYEIKTRGKGMKAKTGKYVKVHFKGKLPNGIVFSNSRDNGSPHEFQLGSNSVPAGLNEGIAMLQEGGKATLILPPELAYGSRGASGVPPNSTVEYDIELINVSSVPTQQAATPGRTQSSSRLANFRSNPVLNSVINLRSPNKANIQLAIALVTNETRKKNGLPELAISPELTNAAQMHADDMKAYKFYGHNNTKDRSKYSPELRARMHGVSNPSISENLNQGFAIQYIPNTQVRPLGRGIFADMSGRKIGPHTPLTLADAQIKAWMNSAGHKRNLLDPSAVAIGCGVSFYNNPEFEQMPSIYAVQKFQRGKTIVVGASNSAGSNLTVPRTSGNPSSRRGIIPSRTIRNVPGDTGNNSGRIVPGGFNPIKDLFGQ